MKFTTKRGRPKKIQTSDKDYGTPELREKNQSGITAEPLDLAYAKGIIDRDQHWCGIHFRWLYTIRYGLPTVRAVDVSEPQGISLTECDEEWKESREIEYRSAADVLQKTHHLQSIMNFVIYGIRPAFLLPRSNDLKIDRNAEHSLNNIKSGLDELKKLWLNNDN